MERPRRRADEIAAGKRDRGHEREQPRAPEAVQGVVEPDRTRMQLALLESRADPSEQREVGADGEREELPPTAALR